MQETEFGEERAVIVACRFGQVTQWDLDSAFEEAESLTVTAGALPVGRLSQARALPDRRTFLGSGKAKELATIVAEVRADIVVVNHELSPSQQRNLQETVNCKVVDRTGLILDIFAQRAYSSEGKIQVELAQYDYQLTRLRGRGVELSRLGGGIGTRGPGETKLEVDLRRMRSRMSVLKKELAELSKRRGLRRRQRRRDELFSASLVGYTNAGKSTLLNKLTGARALVEDRLFATLDSTTRRLNLKKEGASGPWICMLSDTVGFIQDLPHELIEAFKSTLEEVSEADLVIHVVNSAHPRMDDQVEAVERVLSEIGAGSRPRLTVFNQVDRIDPVALRGLRDRFPAAQFASATDGTGLDDLVEAITDKVLMAFEECTLHVPFGRGDVLAEVHRRGFVSSEAHTDRGTVVNVKLRPEDLARLRKSLESGPATGG